jgi:hypothetical protein
MTSQIHARNIFQKASLNSRGPHRTAYVNTIAATIGCLISNAAFSQAQQVDTCSQSVVCIVRDDATLALDAIGHVLSSPVRWRTDEWLMAGGVVVGTVASSSLDAQMPELMDLNRNNANDHLQKIVVEYGFGVTGVALTGCSIPRDFWSRIRGCVRPR